MLSSGRQSPCQVSRGAKQGTSFLSPLVDRWTNPKSSSLPFHQTTPATSSKLTRLFDGTFQSFWRTTQHKTSLFEYFGHTCSYTAAVCWRIPRRVLRSLRFLWRWKHSHGFPGWCSERFHSKRRYTSQYPGAGTMTGTSQRKTRRAFHTQWTLDPEFDPQNLPLPQDFGLYPLLPFKSAFLAWFCELGRQSIRHLFLWCPPDQAEFLQNL